MPKIISPKEAAALIPNNATVMFGGFVGCGCAYETTAAMEESGVTGLKGICNDSSLAPGFDGADYCGYARLIHTGQMVSYIGSHLGTNAEASAKWADGSLKVELVPQGSLAEMIRAGGSGLGGVITPTGVGTIVEESPLVETKLTIDGKDYLVMKPLKAEFAVLCGTKVDKAGNVWFKGTTSNFQTVMALAADTVIVEAEELVEVGEIEPENVRIPGILVKYIVKREGK